MDKKIEDKYTKIWKEVILSTEPGDMVKAEELIRKLYDSRGFGDLEQVFIVDNPVQGALLAHRLNENADLTEIEDRIANDRYEDIKDYDISASFSGQSEGYWIGWYDMEEKEYGKEMPEGFNELRELTHHVSWVYSYSDCVILCKKPTVISEQNGEIHNFQGPALSYGGGVDIYAIKGSHRDKTEWAKESAPYRCSLGRLVLQGGYTTVESETENDSE